MVDDDRVRSPPGVLQDVLKEFSTIADFSEIVTEGKDSKEFRTIRITFHGDKLSAIRNPGKQKTGTHTSIFGGGKADATANERRFRRQSAGLAEMTCRPARAPGFTIQRSLPGNMRTNGVSAEVERQMDAALRRLEGLQGRISAGETTLCW